jgi:hypothetical protein
MVSTNVEPLGVQLVAATISKDPTPSIYRRFATLNARNIIYLQSEIADLEKRLLQLDATANAETASLETWSIPRSWNAMRRAGMKVDTETETEIGKADPAKWAETWKAAKRLQVLLEAYSASPLEILLAPSFRCAFQLLLTTQCKPLDKALQAQAWLHTRERPAKNSREALLDLCASHPELMSQADIEYLQDKHVDDLASLAAKAYHNPLSHFLGSRFSRLFLSKVSSL